MPTVSPIDIRALAKKGVLDGDRFFKLLSEQNNYVDTKTVKDFYMGLVRLITKDLRENGVCRLPYLGDFALVKVKDKVGWVGQFNGLPSKGMISGKYILKFYVKEGWRDYFTKLGEKTGKEGELDPREKVLGRTLE